MGLTLITPPTDLPVTLEEQKAWSRIDHADDDAMLQAALVAATAFVETALGRQLVTATWELTLRGFTETVLFLPRPPLQSVTSIVYRDPGGSLITMGSSDYLVDTTADPGTVEPATSWPGTSDTPDAVAIRYDAGYGDPADVPETIKTAIKGLCGWWFEYREAVGGFTMNEAPMHVKALINQARLWHLQ